MAWRLLLFALPIPSSKPRFLIIFIMILWQLSENLRTFSFIHTSISSFSCFYLVALFPTLNRIFVAYYKRTRAIVSYQNMVSNETLAHIYFAREKYDIRNTEIKSIYTSNMLLYSSVNIMEPHSGNNLSFNLHLIYTF